MPVTTSDVPEMMTRHEAAAFLRVSINTLDRMVARHDLEAFKVGGSVRISRTACVEYVNRTSNLKKPPRRTK